MQRALPESYVKNVVRTILVLLAGVAILIACGFYLAFQKHGGTTYAESYKLLAELNEGLVTRVLMVFAFTLLVSAVGAIIISVIYSHRVAGPIYKLGLITKKIAEGDLAGTVRLRTHDVLHDLADEFNNLSGRYRGVLVQLETKTRELAAILDDLEKQPPLSENKAATGKIFKRIDEIRALLNQIKI